MTSAWRGTTTRTPVGSAPRAPIAASDFESGRARDAYEVVASLPASPAWAAGDAGAEPDDDEPTDDAAEDVRRAVVRLLALPGLGECRAQVRIDALAKRLSSAPVLAPSLAGAIDALAEAGYFDAAEGVIAALGRTDAGTPVLKRLIENVALARRLRGAAALSLVQTRDSRRIDLARPRAEAYARAPGDARAKGIESALWSAFHGLVVEGETPDVGSDRAIDACVGWGLRDAFGDAVARGLLRRGSTGMKVRVLAALARKPALDAGEYVAVRRAWREDRDRDVRRVAIAAAVATRPDAWFWEDAVPVVTDASRLGSLRADLLAGLALHGPIAEADVFLFERWIPALASWSEVEPMLRDEAPTADARPGPFVTFVDVATRGRVAMLARSVDLATGSRSAILHEWARRLSDSDAK